MALLPFYFQAKNIIEKKRTSQSAVDSIKTWLNTTSLPLLQEEFIVLFLISCSNNVTAAKKKIEGYFRIKNQAPYIFNGLSLENEDMKKIIKVVGFCLVPRRMNNNIAVCCSKLYDFDYRHYDITAAVKQTQMIHHLCQIYDPPNELVVICDVKGSSFMHLTCVKLEVVKTHLEFLQEGMPLKIKNLHILNCNYLTEKLLNLFKKFIRSEFFSKIQMHPPGTKMEDFQAKWVPASCLPKDYGGDLSSFDEMVNHTLEELRKNQGFFEAEQRLRSNYKP